MTYEQLLVLRAIVTTGTFRGAAEKLNKSQSAISHMLKNLENDTGITLLSREKYRPTLTTAGKVFYKQSIRVIQQMNDLTTIVNGLNTEQEAEIFLAVSATLPLKSILEMIAAVGKKYPATHIHLSRESMAGTIEQLMRGDADIIIATMDGVPVEQVEAIPFTQITIIPVAHPDFEPSLDSRMKTISEMQSYTQIIVADSSSGETPQSRDLLPGGLRWTVSDFAAKKEILLAKLGWGGMPTHMIFDELESGELIPLVVEGYQPRQSHLFQIRRRDRSTGIISQLIWQELMTRQTN